MTNEMWGGRFATGPSSLMEQINASIDFDKRLYKQDIAASKAHTDMLAKTGIISQQDAADINKGLDQVQMEIDQNNFTFSRALEDIHMNVEARLKEIIGDAAGRLHTARSRNDQVATDFRLYIRDQIDQLCARLNGLQQALAQKALEHTDAIMPGFTHLQTAQPVTFGHHLLAYVEMFSRDVSRLKDARARLNESPLGCAALAGTSFPIDRHMTAEKLGFDAPMGNSLDAVSARDFLLETLAAASICAIHLSRFAEEIVIWSSVPFGFITMSDEFTTGSSIMPQKRNPDAAELVRAKAGRIIGALNAVLIVMKGLPLAYSKDMQEDKEQAFDALDNLTVMILAMTGMVADMSADRQAMAAAAGGGFSTATDLADWLVRKLGLPFRQAHHITGELVGYCEKNDKQLEQLTLEELQAIEPGISEDVYSVLSLSASVTSRSSYGGTAPVNVERQARTWLERLKT